MRRSFKVEIQPTRAQRKALLQHAGCARWAWNWGLARKRDAWAERRAALETGVPKEDAPKVPSAVDLHKDLVKLKMTDLESGGVPWMYESSSRAPLEALRNLDLAYQAFFRRCKAGEKPGFPRFKSRSRGIGGFRLQAATHVSRHTIKLPKIGRVRLKPGERDYIPHGTYKSARVIEQAGRWYVSVTPDEDAIEAPPNGLIAVGIDLGVVRLATLSDGTVYENPRAMKHGRRRLRHAQKALSRKRKGSERRAKARACVARIHRRITDIRKDATHKATTDIAKNHGMICIEDLRVANMTRRCRGKGRRAKAGLNRSVQDANFYEFRRQLEYKAKLYGATVIAVNPAYTSQRCSVCGHIESGNRPSQAVFLCLDCGHNENADLNAAKNILVAGSCPETINARGASIRRGRRKTATRPAMKRESAVVVSYG